MNQKQKRYIQKHGHLPITQLRNKKARLLNHCDRTGVSIGWIRDGQAAAALSRAEATISEDFDRKWTGQLA